MVSVNELDFPPSLALHLDDADGIPSGSLCKAVVAELVVVVNRIDVLYNLYICSD